jgi:hypothetical protein
VGQHGFGITVERYHNAEEIARGSSLSQVRYQMSVSQVDTIENPNSKLGFPFRAKI